MAEPSPPMGVWLVDKPAGPTSHDVVAGIRRRLGRRVRVGHAGTLDPFATGLLVVLVGRATRLVRYVVDLDKTYRARVRLGATSATGDPEGPVAPTGRTATGDDVRREVAALPGRRRQRVPALAAVKVDGERLYKRTRRGEVVRLPERDIDIHDATILAIDAAGGWVDIEVRCSKGTYIRQIASDLGEALGCGAYCERLRRLAVGTLDVADAVPPDAVALDGGIEPARALSHLPRRALSRDEVADVRDGRAVPGPGDGATLLLDGATLVAIGDGRDGTLRPTLVLS